MKGVMRNQITNYIRAGYSGINIISCEEARIESELKTIAESLGHSLYGWSITQGIVDAKDGHRREALEPLAAIDTVEELPENSLLLLKDFHQFLEEGNPVLLRKVKESLRAGKTKGKTLIILGCRLALPPELQREFAVVEFALPDKTELENVLDNIAASANLPKPEGEEREFLLEIGRAHV